MNIVVIGGGLAGANAVEELREQGYSGDITLLGAEPHPPYERPPLSKGVLLGNDEPDSVFVHDAQWYADQQVDLRTGSAVTSLDLDGRKVSVGGQDLHYDRLLVATGAQPRHLPAVDRSGADVAASCASADCPRPVSRIRSVVNCIVLIADRTTSS